MHETFLRWRENLLVRYIHFWLFLFQFALHVADAAMWRGAGDNLHGFFGWLQKGLGCLGYSRAYPPATAEAVEIPKAKTDEWDENRPRRDEPPAEGR